MGIKENIQNSRQVSRQVKYEYYRKKWPDGVINEFVPKPIKLNSFQKFLIKTVNVFLPVRVGVIEKDEYMKSFTDAFEKECKKIWEDYETSAERLENKVGPRPVLVLRLPLNVDGSISGL